MTHERVPNTHTRKVRTGIVGSSVMGTVSATCSIGEFSSSSSSSSAAGLYDTAWQVRIQVNNGINSNRLYNEKKLSSPAYKMGSC